MADEKQDEKIVPVPPPVLTDPIALRLAGLVIQQWHDDGPADTFTLLARRGRQSLNELKMHLAHTINTDTALRDDRARAQARASAFSALQTDLLILLQHNYVVCYQLVDHAAIEAGVDEKAAQASLPLVYEADIAAAIAGLRLDQLLAYVSQELTQREGSGHTPQEHGPKAVASALRHLLAQRLVERSPKCNWPSPKPPVLPSKRKKSSTRTTEEQHAEEARAIRQLGLSHTTSPIRFVASAELDKLADGRMANGDAAVPPPSKKQRSDGSSQGSMVLWRINMEEFMLRFRHELLAQQVQRCFGGDEQTAAVVALMMQLSRQQTSLEQMDAAQSAAFSVTELQNSIHKLRTGPYAAVAQADGFSVANTLRLLMNRDQDLQLMQQHADGGYYLNYLDAMDAVQARHCLCWIKAKYGEQGMRVFKVLGDAEELQMEQRTVADKALIVEKDARELLYRMTADGIVAMQEIHKSNDMAPSRSFYTWHVTSGWWPLKNACMRSLLRAAANTLSLLQANRAKAGPGSKKDSMAVQRYRRTEAALMCTLMRLEQELCLFRYRWTTAVT